MDRRRFLAAVAGGSLLAGCGGRVGESPAAPGSPDSATAVTESATATGFGTPPAESSPTATQPTLAELGTPGTVCSAKVIEDFHIRAVGRPAFADDWTGYEIADRYRIGSRTGDPEPGTTSTEPLADEAVVVGLTVGRGDERRGDDTNTERARAYPIPVVWWHEAVNDDFGGPALVTFCSICNTGLVADRLVGGEPATFGVSGQLWQPPGEYTFGAVEGGRSFGVSTTDPDATVRNSGNLVLFDDRTGSFWSQVLGRAICGPQAGEGFEIRPATVTRWGAWRAEHPETDVLLPPPYSELL